MENWFEQISLGDEVQTTKRPPSKKKKKTGSRVKTTNKYPRARQFFDTPQSIHSVEEMHEPLAMCIEFRVFGMVKIDRTTHPQRRQFICQAKQTAPEQLRYYRGDEFCPSCFTMDPVTTAWCPYLR